MAGDQAIVFAVPGMLSGLGDLRDGNAAKAASQASMSKRFI